ncbi:MAG: hypothetical protein K6G20_09190 [Ruminococcus sp.]|nr:hypothetical protein [Ruminococcus sp.]
MKTLSIKNAVSLVSSIANTALVLVDTGNGLRTRLSPQLLEEIGNPEKVEVLSVDDSIIILPAREGNKALEVKKGRYLYDTQLAATIAKLAGINFEERVANGESKSVSVGTYEIGTSDDDDSIKLAIVSFDTTE